MNVYPVNNLERVSVLTSPQQVLNIKLSNMYHIFFDLYAEFSTSSATITGDWDYFYPVAADTFIIGNTNAKSYHLTLKNTSGVTIYTSGTVLIGTTGKRGIHIKDLPRSLVVKQFILTVSGDENIKIGYLFFGEKWDIGSFQVSPKYGIEIRSGNGRSTGGQAYGLRKPTLRIFGASFAYEDNERRKLIEAYIEEALNVQPHIIDPYPKARDKFSPMYATLSDGIELDKREGVFRWDYSLSWQEAR
jgi:hypothetical protein